jgi:glycosyltransferase involved in cell wall biosynthesis
MALEFRSAGAEVARVARLWTGVDPSLVVRLARWLRRNGVDLTHTHNRMALIYGAPAARLSGTPAVHTKHGNNPRAGTELVAGRLAARWVDAFVAVSPEIAAFALGRNEVDARRLSVIANGIELSRFHREPAARKRVRSELGIDAEAWVVGTVGRLAEEKNQALLLRAMAPLLGSESRLVLAGDGPLRSSLVGLAAALRIERFVHFLGARRDVPEVLNAFDVFALCSNTEGLPLVIPEAMATGLPVVSTCVGGVPTVVEEGRTGFLVPKGDEKTLGDRLRMLRSDRELSRAYGDRAQSVAAARFSAERMQREYLGLYEQVLSSRRAASP